MAPPPKMRAERRVPHAQISLKAVVLVIPWTLEGRRGLEEDLERIVYAGVLNKPWSLKNEVLIWELLTGVPNQYDHTVWARLECWSAIK